MLGLYWVWLAFGLLLALVEILAPGYVFLGFGIGALATGAVLFAVGPDSGLAGSVPLLILLFAVLSLAAWLGLRQVLGVRKGQVKLFDRDINED